MSSPARQLARYASSLFMVMLPCVVVATSVLSITGSKRVACAQRIHEAHQPVLRQIVQ